MTEKQNSNYDLEDRTFRFAKDVRTFVKQLSRSLSNIEDGKQLIRSSGSVGANYIEANEALSKVTLSLPLRWTFYKASGQMDGLYVLSSFKVIIQDDLSAAGIIYRLKVQGSLVTA